MDDGKEATQIGEKAPAALDGLMRELATLIGTDSPEKAEFGQALLAQGPAWTTVALLKRLLDFNLAGAAKGIITSASLDITTAPYQDRIGEWYSLTYINDGAGTVYIRGDATPAPSTEAGLNPNETLSVDRGTTKGHKEVWLSTRTGTATVRRWALL